MPVGRDADLQKKVVRGGLVGEGHRERGPQYANVVVPMCRPAQQGHPDSSLRCL